jgi:hypothetical protein
MADTVEMQDIRGLDIDRLAKGFAEESYVFKSDCQVSSMGGDSIRWFQKTAGTLTATTPSATKNVSPLSKPATLEVSWTRNTSYPKKYFVEGFISMEDINSAELDVLATTIRDLTKVIVRDVDSDIWDVMSESQSPSNIQTFATTAVGGDQWDAADYAADIVKDLMRAKRMIKDYNYNPEGASLYLNPTDYESLVNWLISGKGSSIPGFSSEKVKSGVVMQILGLNVKVSNNVTDDYALVIVPKRATTFKQASATTSRVVKEEGIGSRIRVWESGIAYNTDPKAIVLITDTQT